MQRIELRGGDGSANPYLAIAAALGAGIDGIKRSADPGAVGAAGDGRARCRRPCCTPSTSWRPTRWSPACSTPRATGVAGYFADLKREEFFAYHSAVSPWEIDQYLTAF